MTFAIVLYTLGWAVAETILSLLIIRKLANVSREEIIETHKDLDMRIMVYILVFLFWCINYLVYFVYF